MIVERTENEVILKLDSNDFTFRQNIDDIEFELNSEVENKIILIINSRGNDRP